MNTQHTALSDMPLVTVEQIALFREAALKVKKQNIDLILECDTHSRAADDFADQVEKLTKQRDELLALCKGVSNILSVFPDSMLRDDEAQRIIDFQTAIAKAGGV